MGAAGTRIALETAPVALLRDDLMALPEGLRIARATRRVIAQNVSIALVTVAGLLAGVLAGEVHMALGMLVHQGSVLLVVTNALRLTRGGRATAPDPSRAVATRQDEFERVAWNRLQNVAVRAEP